MFQQPISQLQQLAQHPFSDDADERVVRLKQFLHNAPRLMTSPQQGDMRRYPIPDTNESISCVFWNGMFLITGTDIVRVIQYRFRCRNIPVPRPKKLEEGIFSDLRNLKPGQDAVLEEPRSDLLKYLYDKECIRTQKKQKVFFWYKVPHDNLYHDAMERELRRLTTLDNMSMIYQHLATNMRHPTMMMPVQTEPFMGIQPMQTYPSSLLAPMQPSQQPPVGTRPHVVAVPEPTKPAIGEMFGIDPFATAGTDSNTGDPLAPAIIPNSSSLSSTAGGLDDSAFLQSFFVEPDSFLSELDRQL